MHLADAIEAWGQAHRAEMDQAQKERLGGIWTTVRKSDAGAFHIETMTKEDARGVMALFANDDRREVSQTLNRVRKWAIAERDARSTAPPITSPLPGDAPSSGASITGAPPSGPGPVGAPPPIGSTRAAGSQVPPAASSPTDQPPIHTIDPLTPHNAPSMSTHQGPVPQLEPPPGRADESDSPRLLVIAAIIAVILIVIYFAFFRGDDDDPGDLTGVSAAGQIGDAQLADGQTGDGSTGFSGAGSGDFCTTAREFDESDPLENLDFASEEFYRRFDELWAQVAAIAPPELAGDIATIRNTFGQMAAIAAQYGYNATDPGFATALAALDTTAMDAATVNFERYLEQVCGIESSGAGTSDPASVPADGLQDWLGNLSDADAEALGNSILAGLGITPEMAECLNRELGDIAAAAADPAILTQPVCGTTLLDVLQGATG